MQSHEPTDPVPLDNFRAEITHQLFYYHVSPPMKSKFSLTILLLISVAVVRMILCPQRTRTTWASKTLDKDLQPKIALTAWDDLFKKRTLIAK
jgi:hypothetical protein